MKKEFATLYGKAVIENNVLFLRSPYLPFSQTAYAQVGYALSLVVWLPLHLLAANRKMDYFVCIVVGLIVSSRLPLIYDRLVKRSYATRIPLNRIISYTQEDDPHGLQTEVKLYLKNGTYRKILFRTLERQAAPFLESLPLLGNTVEPA